MGISDKEKKEMERRKDRSWCVLVCLCESVCISEEGYLEWKQTSTVSKTREGEK